MPIPWKTLEICRDLTSKVFKCNIRTNWIFQRSIKDVWRQIWYNIVGSHKHKYRLKVFWPGFNFGLQVSPSSKAAQRWQVTKTIAERQRGFQERDPQTPTGHWPPNHHMPTPNSMFPKVLSSWWYILPDLPINTSKMNSRETLFVGQNMERDRSLLGVKSKFTQSLV